MISVCIPVYNFNVTALIDKLSKQCQQLSVPTEIIIIDDCSEYFKSENQKAAQGFEYIELPENIGRAKIRNLFLQYTQYEYLLFLDCDSLIVRDDFLEKYLETLASKPAVVCGGRIYPSQRPKRNKMLSWKHGVYRESMPTEVRAINPNKSFMTNNFVINKTCLKQNKFDDRITKYGHEDTLFGHALAKNNIKITHIDNPVFNGDIETNEVFLQKTRVGVVNLVHILGFLEFDKSFIENVSLLKYAEKTKAFRGLQLLVFKIFKSPLQRLLKNGFVNLKLFNFYKLGVLLDTLKKVKG
jgi:glycosyltransferase involved in cell wall biosynthesis